MIECRGRNGWFKLDHTETIVGKQDTFICLYSKIHGKVAPIMLTGSKDELLTLLNNIIDGIKKGEFQKYVSLKKGVGKP
ncbi:MAG: hypothetical protein ABH950_01195 [Candidatus Altiarchaeota archaeon]